MEKERELGILDSMVVNRIRKAEDVLAIVAAETGRLSKLYEDGGKVAAFGVQMFKRAEGSDGIRKFESAEALREEIGGFLDLCIHFQLPVTLSGLSMWLSVSQPTFDKWTKKVDDPRGVVCAQAKEAVHFINEGLAMQGDMNPILYMYQNKAYHNYIETTKVQLDVAGGDRLTEQEIDEVLNLHMCDDGVFRVRGGDDA